MDSLYQSFVRKVDLHIQEKGCEDVGGSVKMFSDLLTNPVVIKNPSSLNHALHSMVVAMAVTPQLLDTEDLIEPVVALINQHTLTPANAEYACRLIDTFTTTDAGDIPDIINSCAASLCKYMREVPIRLVNYLFGSCVDETPWRTAFIEGIVTRLNENIEDANELLAPLAEFLKTRLDTDAFWRAKGIDVVTRVLCGPTEWIDAGI